MLRLALFTSFAGVLALGAGCTAEFTSAEESGGLGGSETGGTGGTTGGAAGTGGAGGTAGVASAGGAGGTGGTCNGAATPSEDSCVVSEDYGVFVSPKGDDATADGSRTAPFGTLEAALGAAYSAGKRVYACGSEGDFVPNGNLLVIDDSLSGSQIYGGLDCESWEYDASKPTSVVGDYAALYVNGVKGGLRIEDFSFRAVDQTQNSSIGALVKDSEGVLFKRVTFIAGKGADGEAGADGTAGEPGPAPGDEQRGAAATCTSAPSSQLGGSWANPSACGSLGGEGGLARKNQASGAGLSGLPTSGVVPDGGNDNGGGAGTVFGLNGTSGTEGAQGRSGTNGVVSASIGTFHEDGYDPPVAPDGTDGLVGQGGGGGGASAGDGLCVGASGGAGGMGGCGGGRGAGAQGGHASIALLVWQSTTTVSECYFESAAGGVGGTGGDGAGGGAGGNGANGGSSVTGVGKGGNGGVGGDGGNGGSGAGGAGGPSYGLVYAGTKPSETNSCTFKVGAGGLGGAGGRLGGNLNPAPDGPTGESAEIYEQL